MLRHCDANVTLQFIVTVLRSEILCGLESAESGVDKLQILARNSRNFTYACITASLVSLARKRNCRSRQGMCMRSIDHHQDLLKMR